MNEEYIRVLLLDDDDRLRSYLRKNLEKTWGYKVAAASSGEQALELMKEAAGRFDVALVDERLGPGLNGIEVMKQIKSRYPDVECIIFTGWGPKSRQKALRAGAFRHVEKASLEIEELALLIHMAAQWVRFRKISRAILSERDLRKIFELIKTAACSLVPADEATIDLLDHVKGQFLLHLYSPVPDRSAHRHFSLFQSIVESGQSVYLSDGAQIAQIDRDLASQGFHSLAAIPVPSGDGNLGVLYVYDRQPGRFEDGNTRNLLQSLAAQAGLAIVNALIFQQVKAHASYLQALVQTSQGFTRATTQEEIFDLLWSFLQHQLKISTFYIALYDPLAHRLTFPLLYEDGRRVSLSDRLLIEYPEQGGLTGYVVRTGRELHWSTDEEKQGLCQCIGVKPVRVGHAMSSGIFLPLSSGRNVIGVMSVQSRYSHAFSDMLTDTCRALGGQLSVALENIRRIEELELMRQAVRAMSPVVDLYHTLHQIVKGAAQVMRADAVVLWPYDEMHRALMPEELTAVGISNAELTELRNGETSLGRTTGWVMRQGYVAVTDVGDPGYEFLGSSTRDFLGRIGVRSFQGISLNVGDKPLGVLYVDYKRPRTFDESDHAKLHAFASHASLTLKNARLLRQTQRIRSATGIIADIMLQERLGRTLKVIAERTRRLLRSDAVVLYTYNQNTGQFGEYAAEILEQRHPDSVRLPSQLDPDSAVQRLIDLDAPPYYRVVEDHVDRDLWLGGRFVREEAVRAAIGIQLRTHGHKVGVMFVNYRLPHRFSAEEVDTIQLFAAQAAVAIRNAQLYLESEQRVEKLRALHTASQALTGALTLKETLDRIAEQALHLVGGREADGCFSHLALVEGQRLHFAAACEPETLMELESRVGDIDLAREPTIGITGRAVKTGEPQLVSDVRGDPDYRCFEIRTRSELAVPMKVGDQVIGVINVEHPQLNAFTTSDQQALESLAADAAVAIRHARYVELQKAVYEAGKAISSGITEGRKALLSRILEQAATRIRWCEKSKVILGVIQLYDEETQKLILESVYPSEQMPHLVEQLGGEYALDQAKAPKIGVSGRAVLTGKVQRVADVRLDPDYIEFDPRTRSEIEVPLRIGERMLGVLGLESDHLSAFDEVDEQALCSLADMAAIVIENVRQYEELERASEIIDANMAIVAMSIVGSTWQHSIRNDAITIRETSKQLRAELQKAPPCRSYIEKKLERVERSASRILAKPSIPSSFQETELVLLNDLVRERIAQLWRTEPYSRISLDFDLQLPSSATVLVNPYLMRQAIELLVANAVRAVKEQDHPAIGIGTRVVGRMAEIRIRDNGPGLPIEVRENLGRKRMTKDPPQGLGVGLVLTRVIARLYGGELQEDEKDVPGATLVIRLPLKT